MLPSSAAGTGSSTFQARASMLAVHEHWDAALAHRRANGGERQDQRTLQADVVNAAHARARAGRGNKRVDQIVAVPCKIYK